MNTSARMLRLLSLLQTHRYWPGSELAERLEVSPRTLRRDVDRLRDLGYPVDAARGVAGGYQLQAGAAVPPPLLDDREAGGHPGRARGAPRPPRPRRAGGGPPRGGGRRPPPPAPGGACGEPRARPPPRLPRLPPPRLRRRIDALQAVTAPGVLGGGPVLDPAALTTIALACRG